MTVFVRVCVGLVCAQFGRKGREALFDIVPAFVCLYFTLSWGQSHFQKLAHDHRD